MNIKITLNGEVQQIFHPTDTEKLLGIENLDDFIINTPLGYFTLNVFVCVRVPLSVLAFDI